MVFIWRALIDLPNRGTVAVLLETSKREIDPTLYYDCKQPSTKETFTILGENIIGPVLFNCKQVVLAD